LEATSDDGQHLLESGWEATVAEYERSFAEIEEFIEEHDPEVFWQDVDVHNAYEFAFNRVGESVGPSTYLYDQDGQGIQTRDHLDQVLNHWDGLYDSLDENPLMEQELYVVPADAHY
jgi:hypothetical protein